MLVLLVLIHSVGPQLASNLQNSSYLNLPSAGIPGVLRCITTPRSDTVLSLTSHQGRADCKLSWKTAWEAGQVRSPVSVLPRGARKIQELELGLVSAQGQWLSLSVVFAPQSYTMVGRDAPRSQCLLEERVSWDTRAARCSLLMQCRWCCLSTRATCRGIQPKL